MRQHPHYIVPVLHYWAGLALLFGKPATVASIKGNAMLKTGRRRAIPIKLEKSI